jgi:hypothetical protein
VSLISLTDKVKYAAVHESLLGTSRHLVRRSAMSEVGVDRKWLAVDQGVAIDPQRI